MLALGGISINAVIWRMIKSPHIIGSFRSGSYYLPSQRLQHKRDRPLGRAVVFDELAAAPEAHEDGVVGDVQDDDGDFAIGVEGGGGDEVVAVRGAGDAFCARADEAGELAEDVVRGVVSDPAGGGVACGDGAAADAGGDAGMARAVALVEEEVPDGPGFGPVVEVGDDAAGEVEGGVPVAADAGFAV